jgi:hypothetical protein
MLAYSALAMQKEQNTVWTTIICDDRACSCDVRELDIFRKL